MVLFIRQTHLSLRTFILFCVVLIPKSCFPKGTSSQTRLLFPEICVATRCCVLVGEIAVRNAGSQGRIFLPFRLSANSMCRIAQCPSILISRKAWDFWCSCSRSRRRWWWGLYLFAYYIPLQQVYCGFYFYLACKSFFPMVWESSCGFQAAVLSSSITTSRDTITPPGIKRP